MSFLCYTISAMYTSWAVHTNILIRLYNVKGKVHPRTGHEGPEEELRYNSTLSLTSALDGVGGQPHAPAALPLRKTRYPLYRRLGGPQGRSGLVQQNLVLTGIRSPDRPARSKSLYRLGYPGPGVYSILTVYPDTRYIARFSRTISFWIIYGYGCLCAQPRKYTLL
jgi:hypothetical protein